MKAYKTPWKLKMLEKMSDQSGWSATRLAEALKIAKGNASRRYLRPMNNENIIFSKGARRSKGNQEEIPYYIVEDIDVFSSIVRQLVKVEIYAKELERFLSSKYTNNIINKSGFSSVYDIVAEDYLQSHFKSMASKSLLDLPATKEDYEEFARELQKTISKVERPAADTATAEPIYLLDELREIHEELVSTQYHLIEILSSFEPVNAVRFYRENIHKSIVQGLKKLKKKEIITEGLCLFLRSDNYLSPLTSYPVNGTLTLMFSLPFQRIYEDAYILKGDSLKRLSYRAAAIYNNFSDILFELFRNDPPDRKDLEIITKEMIFNWNVASTRLDHCIQLAQMYIGNKSQLSLRNRWFDV